jgi:hypothetical protein
MEDRTLEKEFRDQRMEINEFRHELRREMITLRGKLDIYLIIILAVMIVLARLISHQ